MENRKRKNKKVNTALRKANLIFILIFAVAIILVLIELNIVIKKKKELPATTSISTKEIINNDNNNENVEKINEGLSFETFVDKVYTEEEIRDFSSEEMTRVRQAQIDKKNTSNLTIQKVIGSASSENVATRIATKSFNATDQIVRSTKIVLETQTYYIVKVEWDYINENTSRKYNQQVLVFKEFYYDIGNKTLNMDDIDKVKDILDLKYYIETYSNTGKNIIQSFISKNGESCEYVIYYFDVDYGEEGTSNRIYLTSDTLQINSETGLIESVQTSRIGNGVRL